MIKKSYIECGGGITEQEEKRLKYLEGELTERCQRLSGKGQALSQRLQSSVDAIQGEAKQHESTYPDDPWEILQSPVTTDDDKALECLIERTLYQEHYNDWKVTLTQLQASVGYKQEFLDRLKQKVLNRQAIFQQSDKELFDEKTYIHQDAKQVELEPESSLLQLLREIFEYEHNAGHFFWQNKWQEGIDRGIGLKVDRFLTLWSGNYYPNRLAIVCCRSQA